MIQWLPRGTGADAVYPCEGEALCLLCPTKLSQHNGGVLCNPCRRQVTVSLNTHSHATVVWWCNELLKAKRPRNRKFVSHPEVDVTMMERMAPPPLRRKGHFPQEGHV